MRKALAAALAAVLVAVATAKVEKLEADSRPETGPDLGEGTYMKATAKDGVTRMWSQADKLPAGTDIYKTIHDVEQHGKCRFACYGDKLCGGYSFIPKHHTCELLSAPNFMLRQAENDDWHEKVAWEHTGAEYEPDEVAEKESENIKDGLKQVPKVKKNPGSLVKKKVGDEGHLQMNLGKITELELTKAMTETDGEDKTLEDEDKGLVDDATLKKVEKARAHLYQEFLGRFAHEYEMRAEAKAHRDAYKITKKRVKKHDLIHPDAKMTKTQKIWEYRAARKEVDNRAVRKYQRLFAERLKEWAAEKMYEVQETMKNNQDNEAREEKEKDLDAEKKMEDEKVDGKTP